MKLFARAHLAKAFTQSALGKALLSDASNGNEARGRCRWVSAVRADAQVDELVLIQARGSPCALTVTVLPGGRVICTRYS